MNPISKHLYMLCKDWHAHTIQIKEFHGMTLHLAVLTAGCSQNRAELAEGQDTLLNLQAVSVQHTLGVPQAKSKNVG